MASIARSRDGFALTCRSSRRVVERTGPHLAAGAGPTDDYLSPLKTSFRAICTLTTG